MDNFLKYIPLITLAISIMTLIVMVALRFGDIKHIIEWIKKYEPRIEQLEKFSIEQLTKCKFHPAKRR